ncbi:S1/P1 Nuclease [Idiomarina sp. A28L]|uniref:S1/P1 nuclease n=1 Tax=Idiomarina sp. A28L TaxID=1036674 RepID=UPI0002138E8E|nr:S1/P1 nuclease [Idiomarina sp. A28L]EGN76283.1 S1/P1 Nuclease [Idiomarina sp. A28L]
MRKLVSIIFIGLLIAIPARVMSWGFQGHEYIGALAWEYLTPEAKEWVSERLQVVDEESLSKVTTWADRVRGSEEGRWLGPLHYANIPPTESKFDMQRDCPNRRCIVGAAMDDIEVMFDSSQTVQAQGEALRTFSHWITDMHQPLHLGYQKDRGGNDIRVTFFGAEMNLHRLWDSIMIRGMDLMPGPVEQASLNPLAHPSNTDWDAALIDWASESNELARTYAYADLEDNAELGETYFNQARPIVEQQLIRSAQRMAMIINAAAAAQ